MTSVFFPYVRQSQRFQNFNPSFNQENSRPALFLFDGDVYKSMNIKLYTKLDLDFAQNHLRILSGLYGILKPLDLMQAYRLEMGTNSKEILGKKGWRVVELVEVKK